MKRMLILFAATLASCAALADTWTDSDTRISITSVTATKKDPWDGKIYISYTVVGDVARQALQDGVSVALSVTAKDLSDGHIYHATSLTGDTSLTSGLHNIVWDMEDQGLDTGRISVQISVGCVSTPRTASYWVIDLSRGPEAETYPVITLNEVPSGGWTDEYRTTKLVMRKISTLGKTSFIMGSPANELGRWNDETEHLVWLTTDYYLGVFEVTQKQWNLVMGTSPAAYSNENDQDMHPVECVAYSQIRGSGWPGSVTPVEDTFMGKLCAKTGLRFDLPTEARWEFACRAGTSTAFNNGKTITSETSCANANAIAHYNKGVKGCTARVGSYDPNAWGFYDMHGNVYEWCLDWYGSYGSPAQEPTGPAYGGGYGRIVRGGGYQYGARYIRAAFRNSYDAEARGSDIGFRLSCGTVSSESKSVCCSGCSEALEIGANPTCVITFDANGGTCSKVFEMAEKGSELMSLPTPTRNGYDFLGWFFLADESTQITEGFIVYSNITTHAHWKLTDPIPEIKDNATKEQIATVLDGSADARLAVCITNAANYNAYREWAENVKGTNGTAAAGTQAVKDSPNAWVSFALGSDKLLSEPPTDEDLKVEAFEPSNEAGKFDFTVSVEGVEVASDVQKENLKQVFGLEGAATLDPDAFSSGNVDLAFGTPENGKVKFTAGPKDAGASTFFMKVKVEP